jgi:hypothetical protein
MIAVRYRRLFKTKQKQRPGKRRHASKEVFQGQTQRSSIKK